MSERTPEQLVKALSQQAAVEWRAGTESNELHDLLRESRDALTAALRERDEARKDRDFFDAERIKVVSELETALRERDEARESEHISVQMFNRCSRSLATAVEALEEIRQRRGALCTGECVASHAMVEIASVALAAIRGTEGK